MYSRWFHICRVFLVVVLVVGAAACSSTESTPPTTVVPPVGTLTATVSGTVVVSGTDEPLAGVAVTVVGIGGTTDATGRFEIANVPVGNGRVVQAALRGYSTYSGVVNVTTTGATVRLGLQQQTVFTSGQGTVYIARGTTRVRGIVLGTISRFSSRGFASGNPESGDPTGDELIAVVRTALMPLVNPTDGIALMGIGTGIQLPGVDKAVAIRAILDDVAFMSGRDDLASAPLILYAASAGAPVGTAIMRDMPEQVAGFFIAVPAVFGDITDQTLAIPGYFALAAADTVVDNSITEAVFASARARGARWALVKEAGRTHFVNSASPEFFAALRGFTTEALRTRASALPGNPLLPLDEPSGWLGDPGTYAVSPWSTFTGVRASASWLPSEQAAQLWRAHASRRP